MIRSSLLTTLLFLAPYSILLAQEVKFKIDYTDNDSMIVSKDYGLLYEEPVHKISPDSMPILNPKNYDAKIRLWSPPFEWFNSMPVIGAPEKDEKKADFLNYWWNQGSTQND